jgi:hypothetical protein
MMKPLVVALSGAERWLGGGAGNVTNIQCKPFQNCHSESLLYNKYVLIKMLSHVPACVWQGINQKNNSIYNCFK